MLAAYMQAGRLEAGTDEAGRGCLAGPVVAAAVILPEEIPDELMLLNDSKKLSEAQRENLRPLVEKHALAYGVSMIKAEKIDEINILRASILAMHQALDKLSISPAFILVDGNKFKAYKNIPFATVVKGDGKFLSIAAASILAKTYRDEFMLKQHKKFPHYAWDENKGYPTLKHRAAIKKYGTTPLHRMSFKLLADEQLELF
jgi:ribonuclease HII